MMTNTLAKHIINNFAGILVIGDVHADYDSFMAAHRYAVDNNLFLMSLGDLVDRGDFPFEVVSKMSDLVKKGVAGFVIGNHDDKFRRFYHGAKVVFSSDAKRTLLSVGEARQAEFLQTYAELVEDKFYSGLFHKFNDIILVHAASHHCMWDGVGKITSGAISRALIGEANGQRHADGFPVRLYNWIDEIPMSKIVIVGHDRTPVHNIAIQSPLSITNNNGGEVIFMDTGCGKGGFLSGAILIHDENQFTIDKFVEFK